MHLSAAALGCSYRSVVGHLLSLEGVNSDLALVADINPCLDLALGPYKHHIASGERLRRHCFYFMKGFGVTPVQN